MSELTSEERTAIGHGATELGRRLNEHAPHVVLPWMAAFAKDRLRDYMLLCELADIKPEQHWVQTIEAAIASAEIDS